MHRPAAVFSVLLLLAACGDDSAALDGGATPDTSLVDTGAVDSGVADSGVADSGGETDTGTPDAGGCGDLAEGQGMCGAGRNVDICEGGTLVAYECPMGSVCEADPTSEDGTACICDNVADEVCPDALCTSDPDCTPAVDACSEAEAVYSTVPDFVARENNAHASIGHSLVLRGDLNADRDVLLLFASYDVGVQTGTFGPGGAIWSVTITMNQRDSGFPRSAGELEMLSGSLEITSVEGNLTGTLRDAVFVDNADAPTCEASVPAVIAFDEVITCTSPSGCIN